MFNSIGTVENMPGLRDSSRRSDSHKSAKSDQEQGRNEDKEPSQKENKKKQKQQKQQQQDDKQDDKQKNKDRGKPDGCVGVSATVQCPRDIDIEISGPCCGRRGCPNQADDEPVFCAKCEEEISEGPTLTVLGRKWHPDCFTCESCNVVLAKTPFFLDGDIPFCSSCWSRNVKSTCSVSSK